MDLRYQSERRTPEEMVRHLKSFSLDLKFSAGVWFFAPGGGRFHSRYVPDLPMEGRLEIASGLKDYGLVGLEAHYPSEVNEENLDLWKGFIRDTGIRLVGLAPNIFYEAQYEWGSLSSPIEEARDSAIARAKTTLQLAKELGTDIAIVWPGIDGYENPFGLDLIAARDRFAEGLAEVMDAVPGMPVAEEPKPYEPRGHILYGTTPEGILLAQKVEGLLRHPENRARLEAGESLVGLNPEVGHVLMGFEDLPYALSLVLEYGKLMHTHWNSQPLGNYDQDLNAGVISPEQMEAALYVLKMQGYRGYFGIDINPERMPVEQALRNNMDALRAANDRINSLDHEKVIFATAHPDRARGWLEAYLIRMRAPSSSTLAPLPPLPAG
ncbi:MAG: TIM barrel protein [Anaerolineae bacterium]|nr:TIM barrel protein [Anaerolineae bacterium]